MPFLRGKQALAGTQEVTGILFIAFAIELARLSLHSALPPAYSIDNPWGHLMLRVRAASRDALSVTIGLDGEVVRAGPCVWMRGSERLSPGHSEETCNSSAEAPALSLVLFST